MGESVMDNAEAQGEKQRLRNLIEEETAKFLASGGSIKRGPSMVVPVGCVEEDLMTGLSTEP